MAKATNAKKPNLFARFFGYLGDSWRELKRVVWPGRQEVINSSFVVIVTLLFFIAFTLVVDQAVIQIIRLIGGIGS